MRCTVSGDGIGVNIFVDIRDNVAYNANMTTWAFDGETLTDGERYFTLDKPFCTSGRGFLTATARRVNEDWSVGEVVVGMPGGAIDAMEAYYEQHPNQCGVCSACGDADWSGHYLSHAAGQV